jgi:hypothetical protein
LTYAGDSPWAADFGGLSYLPINNVEMAGDGPWEPGFPRVCDGGKLRIGASMPIKYLLQQISLQRV